MNPAHCILHNEIIEASNSPVRWLNIDLEPEFAKIFPSYLSTDYKCVDIDTQSPVVLKLHTNQLAIYEVDEDFSKKIFPITKWSPFDQERHYLPICLNTSRTHIINSGPTPSPGTSVTLIL